MNIEKTLKQYGLTESEIRIYLYLLEAGPSTPPEVSKGTGIALTNSYHVFKNLKDEGLIEETKRGKRKVYLPTDPSALVQNFERRKLRLEEALPDLRALYKSQKYKPSIKFYEGLEQIRSLIDQTLDAEEVLFIGSTHELEKHDKKFFSDHEKRARKKGIIWKDLIPVSSAEKTAQGTKERLGELYTALVLPKKYKDTPVNIYIWNDDIALISLDKTIFGTQITNHAMAEMFRILFELSEKASEKIL